MERAGALRHGLHTKSRRERRGAAERSCGKAWKMDAMRWCQGQSMREVDRTVSDVMTFGGLTFSGAAGALHIKRHLQPLRAGVPSQGSGSGERMHAVPACAMPTACSLPTRTASAGQTSDVTPSDSQQISTAPPASPPCLCR
jgi:hypothetical protein